MRNTSLKVIRNSGIDFLRVLAMFYVIILHTLGRGGVLSAAKFGSHQYMIAWFMEIWAYCAVDVFALISGYVGYREKEKNVRLTSWFSLWFQIIFYGLIVTWVFNYFHPELVTKLDFIKMIFPVTNNLYWYFTAYTGLFLCMPLLDAALRKFSKEMAMKLFFVLFLGFSFYDTIAKRFVPNGGYSFIWIVILYVLGAIIKKCEIGKNFHPILTFVSIFLLIFCTWFWKMHGIEFTILSCKIDKGTFVSYTSPTIVCVSILYIIAFSKLSFKRLRKVISFMAPGAFAAYILNNQYWIWTYGMKGRFIAWATGDACNIFGKVIGFSASFVLISILCDKIRKELFKILHVDDISVFISDKLSQFLNYVVQKLN